MKGVGVLVLVIPLVILGAIGTLYVTNFPITQVAGETIGFADLINFLLFQGPPGVPEADVSGSPEVAAWFASVNGSDAGETLGMLESLGNPVKVCVFKDYSYCQVFRIEGGKIFAASESPQRTIYVSYELALELKSRAENANYEGLDKRLVQAVKNGELKGLTLNDIMGMNK
jgi:hypothetical protein